MEHPSFQLPNSGELLSLNPTHVLPECNRPQLGHVSHSASIPVVDLNGYVDETSSAPSNMLHQVSQACEQYDFFQIVNHGLPEQLCIRMLNEATQVFQHPHKERAQLLSDDPMKDVRFTNYYLEGEGNQERVNIWSESFCHPWNPANHVASVLLSSSFLLPFFVFSIFKFFFVYMLRCRNVASDYAKEVGSLVGRLLSLISQGLGLKNDYLKLKIGEPRWRAQANYYPPCPDPELTLGLPVHTDLNAITVLMQSKGASGLQVIKDGKWTAVHPAPNALVINVGDQIQVLSNGRYKSVHHRAVSSKGMRVSVAMFYGPDNDTVIGPIEDLVDNEHPPIYRNYKMSEFLEEFIRQKGKWRMVKEAFQVTQVLSTED